MPIILYIGIIRCKEEFYDIEKCEIPKYGTFMSAAMPTFTEPSNCLPVNAQNHQKIGEYIMQGLEGNIGKPRNACWASCKANENN
jgi:hypothetical protein